MFYGYCCALVPTPKMRETKGSGTILYTYVMYQEGSEQNSWYLSVAWDLAELTQPSELLLKMDDSNF